MVAYCRKQDRESGRIAEVTVVIAEVKTRDRREEKKWFDIPTRFTSQTCLKRGRLESEPEWDAGEFYKE
jgi:hypothetical protein